MQASNGPSLPIISPALVPHYQLSAAVWCRAPTIQLLPMSVVLSAGNEALESHEWMPLNGAGLDLSTDCECWSDRKLVSFVSALSLCFSTKCG